MRLLNANEMRQRGCAFCKDIKRCRHCPHNECPYHDLVEFKAFEEFCESYPEVDLRELFRDLLISFSLPEIRLGKSAVLINTAPTAVQKWTEKGEQKMEREQIIKALGCCHTPKASDCNECGYRGQSIENGEYIGCSNRLMTDALSLINELTRKLELANLEIECKERICESYMLQYGTVADKEVWLKKERADTVRKMHSEIKDRCIKGGIYPAFVARTIDQIAKEMVED